MRFNLPCAKASMLVRPTDLAWQMSLNVDVASSLASLEHAPPIEQPAHACHRPSCERMAKLAPAKALLHAVQLAYKSDISQLRTLINSNRIPRETLFRVILTYLPETLHPNEYLPLIEDLVNGSPVGQASSETSTENSNIDELSEEDAKRRARKLHLLPLRSSSSPSDIPDDSIVLFLIHRSLRIDESTGLLNYIPTLLVPFFHYSDYLRTWFISCVLPLLRLSYEYHPGEVSIPTISAFDALGLREAVALLLSKTGNETSEHAEQTVGQDIKGLIGPWMYGQAVRINVKPSSAFSSDLLASDSDIAVTPVAKGWEVVFKWLIEKATSSWITTVKLVEQWDGPDDVDLGGHINGMGWMDEDSQQYLEVFYARSVLASVYSVSDSSPQALIGVGRMLLRLISLLDQERIPTLEQAAALLQPVTVFENNLLSTQASAYLRNDLLKESNLLTSPSEQTIHLAHALATSALIFARNGVIANVRSVGELTFLQDQSEQRAEFHKFIARATENVKQDDKYWIRIRNEVLWLRDWGTESSNTTADNSKTGRGPFGKLSIEFLEQHILEALLNTSRTPLPALVHWLAANLNRPDIGAQSL